MSLAASSNSHRRGFASGLDPDPDGAYESWYCRRLVSPRTSVDMGDFQRALAGLNRPLHVDNEPTND